MNISQLVSSKNSWGPIYAVGTEKELVKYDTGFVAYVYLQQEISVYIKLGLFRCSTPSVPHLYYQCVLFVG